MCSKGLFLPVGPCILPHLSQAMLLFRAVFAPGKPSEGWPGVGMDDAARPSCVLPAVRPGQVKQPLWCSAASSEKYGVGSPRVLPNPIQSVVVVVMTIMLTFLTALNAPLRAGTAPTQGSLDPSLQAETPPPALKGWWGDRPRTEQCQHAHPHCL